MKKNDQRMIKMFLSSVVTILLFTNGMAVLADDSSTDMTGMSDVTQKAPAEDMEQSNRQTAEPAIRSNETVDSAINSFQETDLKVQEKEDAAAAVQTESASIDSNEQEQSVSANTNTQPQAKKLSNNSHQEPMQMVSAANKERAVLETAQNQKNGNMINLTTDKAVYQAGEAVHLNLTLNNTTSLAQNITATVEVYSLENKLKTLQYTKYLLPNESYTTQKGEFVIPANSLANNRGYLLKVNISDSQNNILEQGNRAIAVEDDWRTFPRYAAIGGSQKDNNSVLTKNLPDYYRELEQMKNMNINSYFFYDVYKSATNPFPNVPKFDQSWNWWSHSQVETDAVKALVNRVHQTGAVAMLYNMILAQNANETAVLPDTEYIYNYETGGYGQNGQVMTYSIDDKPLQYYYNPLSKSWQNYISNAMAQAMKNGGFDGWQGDTIGDNRVLSHNQKDSRDIAHSFMLSDVYAEFLNKMKEKLPQYYLTLNDVNGENISKLANSKQDVIYNELWPFGTSALGNRPQESYGDLKARVDQVRQATGKSLIVGAYMEEPKFDDNRIPLNGAARDVLALATYQTDAVLLTTAAIAAAGGYHMSLAALANPNDGGGVGVLETAYYPTQSLKVSKELNRKNYHYQQFITAYENLLRDKVENDSAEPQTFTANGRQLSQDALGINGDQVWTYAKKGNDFRTIQLLNLMGITSDWKNEDGYENNKTPDEQTNLLVTYPLTGVSMAEADRIAKQVYLTSPDDWLQSSMISLATQVKTNENGDPVLYIQVPRLTLWDMIYINETIKPETPKVPEQPQHPARTLEPAIPQTPEAVSPLPVANKQSVDENKNEIVSALTGEENDLQLPTLSKRSLSISQAELPQTGDNNETRSNLLKVIGAGALLIGAAGLLSLIKGRKKD